MLIDSLFRILFTFCNSQYVIVTDIESVDMDN